MRPLTILFAATVALVYAHPAAAVEAVGVWYTEGYKSKVEITECGSGGELCSEIVWLRQPNDKRGRPLRDGNNPNANLRKRPIIGLPILQNLKPYRGRTTQWAGRIYNPEDGRTYKAYLTVVSQSTIKLQGCALGGLVCGTMMWKRYDPSLPDEAQIKLPAKKAPKPAAIDAEDPWEN